MIDISLLFLGMLGAVLAVYLGKQEAIPEFPLLFDTASKEKEAAEHLKHISSTQQDIDAAQEELKKESLSDEYSNRLSTIINTSLSELREERRRLRTLEREIKQSQIISRSVGFLFYIVLGGVFGALLAGIVEVQGLAGKLPNYFESMLIGATWTSYLGTIGFRTGQKRTEDRIEKLRTAALQQIDIVKKELPQMVAKKLAEAETAEKVAKPQEADKVARQVAEKLDQTRIELEESLSFTKQMLQRDLRRLL